MYQTFYDKETFFDRAVKQSQRSKERDSSTKQTKQRICRKGHGLLDGFRDLSLVGGDSYSIARR